MLYGRSRRCRIVDLGGAGGASADEGGRLSFTKVMTVAGLAVSVLLGSVLTAQAVVAGDPTTTFVRFAASILFGGYYLVLYRLLDRMSAAHR
jgi:hypothetical protein